MTGPWKKATLCHAEGAKMVIPELMALARNSRWHCHELGRDANRKVAAIAARVPEQGI
jgi:hypothetical protein